MTLLLILLMALTFMLFVLVPMVLVNLLLLLLLFMWFEIVQMFSFGLSLPTETGRGLSEQGEASRDTDSESSSLNGFPVQTFCDRWVIGLGGVGIFSTHLCLCRPSYPPCLIPSICWTSKAPSLHRSPTSSQRCEYLSNRAPVARRFFLRYRHLCPCLVRTLHDYRADRSQPGSLQRVTILEWWLDERCDALA